MLRAYATTTHVDRHNERMTLEALRGMAEQMKRHYIPLGIGHDVRIAPLGRVVQAQVVPLADGEYALETITEVFEPGDDVDALKGDGRTIPLRVDDYQTFAVSFDRTFIDKAGRDFIAALKDLGGPECTARAEGKKALEPVSTLTIMAGSFALGGLASGFLNKLGSDAYDALKTRLAEFYGSRKLEDGIVDFLLVARRAEQRFEVHVLVTPPTASSIRRLLGGDFVSLDRVVVPIADAEPDIAKLVIEWRDGQLHPLYAVRRDAVPTIFDESARARALSPYPSVQFGQAESTEDS